MMRIAYLHQYYQSRERAGGTRSYEFGRRLVDRGHEVHMITTDSYAARPGSRWRVTEEGGMTVHWLPVPYANTMSAARRIISFGQFAALAGPRAARVRPDVVLASSTPLTIAVPGLLATRLARSRFVFEVRDLWPEVPIEMGFLKNPVARHLAVHLAEAAYRRADQVIALSPGMAEGVIRHGYPAGQIVVVPNAADLDLFAAPPAEVAAFRSQRTWLGDRPLVVYTGTFGSVNGVDYLVRLAAQVRDLAPDIRFLLVGRGAHYEPVRALAQQMGLLDQTVFLSEAIPRSELPLVLGAASIATSVVIPVPGLENNSANKFFDSLAAGRPIAINHGGWQADLIEETGAGLVLDPHDVSAAARLLVRRITDRQWLETAGRAAGDLATQRFSRDRLFELFEQAVTGRRNGTMGDRDGAGTHHGMG
jgi:glycosyltransferase involved in cell wall biosynthesis